MYPKLIDSITSQFTKTKMTQESECTRNQQTLLEEVTFTFTLNHGQNLGSIIRIHPCNAHQFHNPIQYATNFQQNHSKQRSIRTKLVFSVLLLQLPDYSNAYFQPNKQAHQQNTSKIYKNYQIQNKGYLLEKLLSELTVILFLSLVTVTESPSAPALPPTLILSRRNFSNEAMSMILSSTGFAQSITKVTPFFFPLGPPDAAAPRLIFCFCFALTSCKDVLNNRR